MGQEVQRSSTDWTVTDPWIQGGPMPEPCSWCVEVFLGKKLSLPVCQFAPQPLGLHSAFIIANHLSS